MDAVLPEWLDQVQGTDFSPEKEMLSTIEEWAGQDGWRISRGETLPSELRSRTDVLMQEPDGPRHFRIAVLPKAKGGAGAIRIDASTHRVFELLYQPRTRRWRLETSSVPLSDDIRERGWSGLMDLAFRP